MHSAGKEQNNSLSGLARAAHPGVLI